MNEDTFEMRRIRFLIERDGMNVAREWAARTLGIYVEAIDSPHSHASLPQYRPLFRASVETFRRWLNTFD